MDVGIREMQEKIEWIQGNPDLFRAYLRYEKAASDEVSRINGARREGREEGRREGRQEGERKGREEGSMNKAVEIAVKMKKRGVPLEQIVEDTGLSIDEIANL
jgi:predicted transposase/invertase (TIGR01784 family)